LKPFAAAKEKNASCGNPAPGACDNPKLMELGPTSGSGIETNTGSIEVGRELRIGADGLGNGVHGFAVPRI
jgi:hypothetical protein